jgi:hypothetical protein
VISTKRLTPWPGVASVSWQLVRVQLIAAGVVLALSIGAGLARAWGGEPVEILLGGLALPSMFLFFILLLLWPIVQAVLLTARHQPQRNRAGPYIGLLVLGWVAGVAVGTVFLAMLALSALLVSLGSLR